MSSTDFLKGYELANDSIRRFWHEFPAGRLATSIVEPLTNFDKGYVTIKADVYRDFDDPISAATGYAHGNVATYLASMKRFYVEDTETSALTRAIKTLSPSEMRPSVEEMNRVDRLTLVPEMPKAQVEIQVSSAPDPWTIYESITALDGSLGLAQPPESPMCSHGHMIFKEGVSAKTGKAYKGHVCPSKSKDEQCRARWEE